MRPVLNLFFLFGSSVGFSASPMMRRMAVSSFAGSGLARAASATSLPCQEGKSKFCTTTSMNTVDFVEKEIESNKVVVFSKSYCPFCTRTKTLFAGLGVDATVYELDQMNDGDAIQAALAAKTGQTTVPNVFVKGTHVGGNDAVQAANNSGALKELLDN